MELNTQIIHSLKELLQTVELFKKDGLASTATVRTIEFVAEQKTGSAAMYQIGSENCSVNYSSIIAPLTKENIFLHRQGLQIAYEIAIDKKLSENSDWFQSVFEKWGSSELNKFDKHHEELKPYDIFIEEGEGDEEAHYLIYFNEETSSFEALMMFEGGSFPLSDFETSDIWRMGTIKNNSVRERYRRFFPDMDKILPVEKGSAIKESCESPTKIKQ